MKPVDKKNLIFYIALPVLGTAFLMWYIYAAGFDAVYSDYIRIINEYLPDVGDIKRLFTPDILTRTPVYFLQRYINVKYFDYSVTFDRICSVLSVAVISAAAAVYAKREKTGLFFYVCAAGVCFSLSKWEVLLNGTSWVHVFALGCFFINFLLFDSVWKGDSDAVTELLCYVMPFLWLFIAGEYIAAYLVSMVLVSLFGAMTGGAVNYGTKRVRKVFLRICASTLIAGGIYVLSRSFAEWEHAGAAQMTFKELMEYAPSFLPRFFLKSLAGTVLGAETITGFIGGKPLPDAAVYLLGAAVLAGYMCAFYVYFDNGINERSVFPLILMVEGLVSHLLILYARWIFLNENYGMSSRYQIQFLPGITGIILVFSLYRRPERNYRQRLSEKREKILKALMGLFAALCLMGSVFTTYQEIKKAPYRKANYENMAQYIISRNEHTEEELCAVLEWRKAPEDLDNALNILSENSLNVYSPRRGRR